MLCCLEQTFLSGSAADAPASLSTACDKLLEQLNDVSFIGDVEHKNRCTHLRRSLTCLNRDQGLGFRIVGVVVDKRYMVKLLLGVASMSTGIIGGLVALGTKESVDETDDGSDVYL